MCALGGHTYSLRFSSLLDRELARVAIAKHRVHNEKAARTDRRRRLIRYLAPPLLSKPHAKSCVPPQVAIRVPALGLREIRMADKVRAFIHNALQAAVWKIAIRNICKAIEQLDDQITDLVTRVKKLEGKS